MQSGDSMDARRLMAMVNSLSRPMNFQQPNYDYNQAGWRALISSQAAASDPKLKTGKRRISHKKMLANALRSHH